jgi:hypothetical protein
MPFVIEWFYSTILVLLTIPYVARAVPPPPAVLISPDSGATGPLYIGSPEHPNFRLLRACSIHDTLPGVPYPSPVSRIPTSLSEVKENHYRRGSN